MINQKKKLGQLLIEAGLIDEMQLKSALAYQMEWGGRIGAALVRKGIIRESDMITVIEKQMGMSCIPLHLFEKPSDEMLRLLNEETAKKFGIFPVSYNGKTLAVATSDPTDLKMLDDLGFLLGIRIKPLLALESDIMAAIDHFYNPLSTGERLRRNSTVSIPQIPESETNFEIIRMHEQSEEAIFLNWDDSKEEDYSTLVRSVVTLLLEKKIFTSEELAAKIRTSRH